jgi:hypothetical protein
LPISKADPLKVAVPSIHLIRAAELLAGSQPQQPLHSFPPSSFLRPSIDAHTGIFLRVMALLLLQVDYENPAAVEGLAGAEITVSTLLAQHGILLYSTVRYCTVLHCTAPHCNSLHC